MACDLAYNSDHQVLICTQCQTCIAPGARSIAQHLRAEPHRLSGDLLKAQLSYAQSLSLKTKRQLREDKPARRAAQLEHLRVFHGFQCLSCDPSFLTTHLPRMRDHMVTHGRKASEHKATPLWQACLLQTYFTAPRYVDYFVVVANPGPHGGNGDVIPLTRSEKDSIDQIEQDALNVKKDLFKAAGVVRDIKESRSERVPWLHDVTKFPFHLVHLKDEEIWASYKLPSKKELDGDYLEADDPQLVRILHAAEAMMRDAYQLCSDTSPDRKMTQQRANILNEFYSGASGKADGFRYHKNASTLVKYFLIGKQLLVYYYRVVYSEDGFFTATESDQSLPRDIIEPTSTQIRAMDAIMEALNMEDPEESELALKHAIRRLYLALICHSIGSAPFKSPVLSFCAMKSRMIYGRGLWEEPGNFNSYLSALTWTAQLILFGFVCFQEQEDEDQIPILLTTLCKKFFQQLAETPFGYILQWRLYLFKVSKASIAKHQARWSLDRQIVGYRGVEISMEQISNVVLSEFQQAHSLLYDELLFGMQDLISMVSWRMKDDLDSEDFGDSWLSHSHNSEFLEGADLRLFRYIKTNTKLHTTFFKVDQEGGLILCSKAMKIYEVQAQEFLKRLLILCHIAPGPPLREPELLSITWRNMERQRHIYIWEKLVMIYTQYHKGQQQSGAYKNNIRFLPKAIGNLLLTYIAYVIPLRQIFLRQENPTALISPYLWSNLQGTVWVDGVISTCLRKACKRAQVSILHTSNWRQFAASITKEKFTTREQANFDLDHTPGEFVEDESDLRALAEFSNHSFQTFNVAYAGTTNLTMNTMLHRGFRASASWHSFFRFDFVLQGKRASSPSDALVLRAAKRSRFRQRQGYSEEDLLQVAQRLFPSVTFQFRQPGQRRGVLTTFGTTFHEQVILILGTGSGKTLIPMLSASLADASTTIMIIPMVALRIDMIKRFNAVGIPSVVWSVECRETPPLVIVSAEAVCNDSFLEYAQGLVFRQKLDRIIMDECHLTITTSEYRSCMTQVGWFIRQIRTQSIWLSATLPPVMEELFIEQNKLVCPQIIRESTNRSNLQYLVSYGDGVDSLMEKARELIEVCWPDPNIFDQSCDKIIIYCRTRDVAGAVAELMNCPLYTSESGTVREKGEIIQRWLSNPQQPVIAATSALGIGFDYPHIRWVIHLDAPERVTAFSQESGRAGRDGRKASSIILLNSTWRPQRDTFLPPDQATMQLYLTQQYCSRGVLSQFLDRPSDWRWCMSSDEVCQVCREPHEEPRPPHLIYTLNPSTIEIESTGPREIHTQDFRQDQILDRYEQDLLTFQDSCLYCRIHHRRFDHLSSQCSRRFDWINAKGEALQACQFDERDWMPRYIVCWNCYQPQDICRVADPDHEESECRFPNMVIPICVAAYKRVGGGGMAREAF
ncbi:uncharacterized protein EAF01_000538 [Botrytis porri]|uniref:uncharacterized protein n=1 Tax=Botrytis porri TaxID=87229 RepID=UPI0018FF4483|nr:uncharacterized protein EAF01_011951 [Botrytis porri]XP_038764557.1 uncharacterized protein EAF01_011769 [Botrytis porri]XP_038764661.1 uncharacterized protein EAF01_011699 [Botrytis porri]XP_038764938.1 uncharacterized protein EAF01_011470 [Botrytis porri]XP_038766024.1 uncharacterized protein EAF01_010542 [Botrytis porri]XP_038775694.1 uncharacterized protein EAF01_000538 [Botrytis porri]KAF7880786.1 hypothetical protein EAF01_011951 [Botrytis porri]KAF7882317.1 hypothetical protein EAF